MTSKKDSSPGRRLSEGSYCFEDLQTGDHFETGSTKVTAQVISRFAALSGDHYALHLDDSVAREMGFPSLIAHGILIMALADGLKYQSPVELEAVASLGWDIAFSRAVFAGDSISAVITVKDKRVTSKPDRGIATLGFVIVNQDGEPVQRGTNLLMMRRGPRQGAGNPEP